MLAFSAQFKSYVSLLYRGDDKISKIDALFPHYLCKHLLSPLMQIPMSIHTSLLYLIQAFHPFQTLNNLWLEGVGLEVLVYSRQIQRRAKYWWLDQQWDQSKSLSGLRREPGLKRECNQAWDPCKLRKGLLQRWWGYRGYCTRRPCPWQWCRKSRTIRGW